MVLCSCPLSQHHAVHALQYSSHQSQEAMKQFDMWLVPLRDWIFNSFILIHLNLSTNTWFKKLLSMLGTTRVRTFIPVHFMKPQYRTSISNGNVVSELRCVSRVKYTLYKNWRLYYKHWNSQVWPSWEDWQLPHGLEGSSRAWLLGFESWPCHFPAGRWILWAFPPLL